MGALTRRRIGLKTLYRTLTARAVKAEAFAWIEVITVLYKAGRFSTRDEAVQLLNTKVTKEDLREYRRTKEAALL